MKWYELAGLVIVIVAGILLILRIIGVI